MKPLNVSLAKAQFSAIVRRVIESGESVVVRAPAGYVQIVPYGAPKFIPPLERGSIELTDREIEISNRFPAASNFD